MISSECILPGASLGFSIQRSAPLPSPDHSAAGSAVTSFPGYTQPSGLSYHKAAFDYNPQTQFELFRKHKL